jgi:hypothetical protein
MKYVRMPLPLLAKRLDNDHSCIHDAAGGVVVRTMITEDRGPEAQFIVDCVNNHFELVEALRRLERSIVPVDMALGPVGEDVWPAIAEAVIKARAVLAKVPE